ncbi:MAG TPA: M50 family metallopeptidase [Erysipelotrichaceae bacterium]|nr:M50 family metallopeptidase [Erysipelotrichaceae bacterium]
MTTFLYFALVLGVIVLIHEIGHLVTAKLFNVYCKEFAVGMGPKIFSKKFKETEYSIRALPLGGFVAMAGEEGVDDNVPFERSILGIAPWKRMIVMLAGIFMNFVLAFVLFVGIYAYQGYAVEAPKPIIAGTMVDSPAEKAGFMANDLIKKITFSDGTTVIPTDFYEIITYIQMYTDTTEFVVDRNGTEITISVTPEFIEAENRYYLGITMPNATRVEINALGALKYGALEVGNTVESMVFTLTRLIRGIGLNAISGPIGIYQVTATQASYGLINILYLMGLLSINVAIFNLLPLPILDGGRVVLTLYELVFKKPMSKKVEQVLMVISIGMLLLLMAFVTLQDILRLI